MYIYIYINLYSVCVLCVPIVSGESDYRDSFNVFAHSPANHR